MVSISPRRSAICLTAGAITLLLISACVYYARHSRTGSGFDGIASSFDENDSSDATARLHALEQRVKVLEDIVSRRGSRRVQPAGFMRGADDRHATRVSANGKDVVDEKLKAAIALEGKFDKEAGTQTEKSRKTQGAISSAFNEITKVEPRYAPAWTAQPECRSTTCRLQYRYRDESVAEYASTALLMQLNSSFRSADVITLPNNDGTYDLLIYGHLE